VDRKTAIVITTFNHAHFLSCAIESCLRQTAAIDEIIVIDDGSTDDPASVVARYRKVRIISQENRGLAAARNTGVAATDAAFLTFLDADDRLLPEAMEVGIRHLEAQPSAAMVYGAHRMVDVDGRPVSAKIHIPVFGDAYLQFLRRGNFVGMHATVVYRRERLAALGGFDESFRSCEDYELFMRIVKTGAIVSHDCLVAEYRKHGQNMSNNRRRMLAAALRVLDVQSASIVTAEERLAIAEGRKFWRAYYAGELAEDAIRDLHYHPLMAFKAIFHSFQMAPLTVLRTARVNVQRRLAKRVPSAIGRLMPERFWTPSVGMFKFGDFARTNPVSKSFGFDRGKPIDRYYIENFLAKCSNDIRGRVLEIGDNSYTVRFGGSKVSQSDVLHVDAANPAATIIGNLSASDVLPPDAFDCIILTQTLHLIYDMRKALANLAQSLKPGGVLLITVPGISPVDRAEWGYTWYWSLTGLALAQLLAECLDPRDILIENFGNVFAAVCFLQGLAVSEVPTAKLDVLDPAFPVVVAGRVVKRQSQ
jgi:glycosyltransferase involved in cell wall biosynthesis